MNRHLARRSPRRKGRFCWARQRVKDGFIYRLFRRSETTGRIFQMWDGGLETMDRKDIARELRRMRRELRDAVDAADLKNLGVEA